MGGMANTTDGSQLGAGGIDSPVILVPSPVVRVQLVIKRTIVDMKFVRADANNRT